jgi:hypothetical protein
MFSAKLIITTLTLVFVAINVAVAAGNRSQCSQWKSSSGLSQSLSERKTIMAKVVSRSGTPSLDHHELLWCANNLPLCW